MTGDPVLAEIQAGLSRVNPVLGGQMARQAKGAVTTTTNAIRLLRGTGTLWPFAKLLNCVESKWKLPLRGHGGEPLLECNEPQQGFRLIDRRNGATFKRSDDYS